MFMAGETEKKGSLGFFSVSESCSNKFIFSTINICSIVIILQYYLKTVICQFVPHDLILKNT